MFIPNPVRNQNDKGSRSNELRLNEKITAPQVRLIDASGQMVGILPRAAALESARNASLDLVEISPHMDPPVCKILDYGKFKYALQKKKGEVKKKQKTVELKEIQIRPRIEEHDYQVKLRGAMNFLKGGHKVKVALQFRGREMHHQEFGWTILKRMQADLSGSAKIESAPKLEGKRLTMILGPKSV